MKCPRCVQDVPSASHQCSHCGFSLAQLDSQFGEECVVLERLTDAADCLTPENQAEMIEFMDKFERQFPQLFLALYIGELPELTSVRQFGFWLLNRAAVPSVDYNRPNENGILLVLDLTSRSLSMTLGYFVEEYFTDEELEKILEQGNVKFAAGDYGGGFVRVFQRLSRELRSKGMKASRGGSKFTTGAKQMAEGLVKRVQNGASFRPKGSAQKNPTAVAK